MIDLPRKVRYAYGYNDILRGQNADKTYTLMFDDEGAPARKKAALGPRRLYVDNRAIKKRDDVVNWNRLTLTRTHQNFTLKNTIKNINDKGSKIIWCTQGAFGNQTIMTNNPPNGAPLSNGFTGMLMCIDVYEYVTDTVTGATQLDQFVVSNDIEVEVGEFIRVMTYKKTITAIDENTPVVGMKTITVDSEFEELVGKDEKVNYHRNDPYNPDSYWEIADAVAMVARIYGHTPDPDGLQPWIDAGLLAENTDQTGGPLNNGTGLGYLMAIEIENEATLPLQFNPVGNPTSSGGEICFDLKSFAACVIKCYDTIKTVDKVVPVMAGGFWGLGNREFYEGFLEGWKEIKGSYPPHDLLMQWHGYWRNSTLTAGTYPEVPTSQLGWYIPPGWGDRGLFSTIEGWDRKKYLWIQGEYNWNSSENSNLTVPVLPNLTGTDLEKREKSQGILASRMTLILLCGKYCKSAINYSLIDDSFSDNGQSQYSNTGIMNNQYNANSFRVKESMAFHQEMMENFGECKIPLHLVRGKPHQVTIVGIEEDTNIMRKATWTSGSTITYSTLGSKYKPSIYKDIFHDLALDATHAKLIAEWNQWPAMRGRNINTSNCTYSNGYVETTNFSGLTINLPDTEYAAEIFIFFESDNDVNLISKNGDEQYIRIDEEGKILFTTGDTTLNKESGLNGLYIKFDEDESEIVLNNGDPVQIDATSITLSNTFYIGGGAKIKAVFAMSKILYDSVEKGKIWNEFGF